MGCRESSCVVIATRRIASTLLLGLAFTSASACGGETVIATNDALGGASSVGGEAGAPPDSDDAGSRHSGGAAGNGPAECTPGEVQTLGACEQCGTESRTCDPSGQWEPSVCENQGKCVPGTVVGSCDDPCDEQLCGDDCNPGTCQLKVGAACKWNNGSVPHCCGVDAWQFCNPNTCQYFPCEACKPGSSCFSAC
jgi:hypothetical protein